MGFFSKLVKGVGKVVGGAVKLGTGIVSKLGIPIVSGAAGIASDFLNKPSGNTGVAQAAALQTPIAPQQQTPAQAATFGGKSTISGNINLGGQSWLTQKTIVSWAPNWVVVIAAPAVVVVGILFFVLKRRRR